MLVCPRWEQVRGLTALGWTPPRLLDKKWGRLIPFACDQWWRAPDGTWIPVIAGGVGLSGRYNTPRVAIGIQNNSGAPAAVSLTTTYIPGTSGPAVGVRFVTQAAVTLTDIYVPASSIVSAPTWSWDVRADAGSFIAPNTAATVAAGTFAPSNGWNRISSVGAALSANTHYWVTIGRSSGAGTGLCQREFYTESGSLLPSYLEHVSASTTGGWASGNSLLAAISSLCLVCSDGTVRGDPWTAHNNPTSASNQKGLQIDGFASDAKLWAATCFVTITNASGFNVWIGNNGPGGSPDYPADYALQSTTGTIIGYAFQVPITLSANQAYRMVFSYSGASQVPTKFAIGTGADANLRSCMPGNGSWYWAEANGTSDWTNDDTNAWPRMTLWLTNTVGPSSAPSPWFVPYEPWMQRAPILAQ